MNFTIGLQENWLQLRISEQVHCVNFTPLRAFWFFRIVHGGG